MFLCLTLGVYWFRDNDDGGDGGDGDSEKSDAVADGDGDDDAHRQDHGLKIHMRMLLSSSVP